jgi:hypothetical protein
MADVAPLGTRASNSAFVFFVCFVVQQNWIDICAICAICGKMDWMISEYDFFDRGTN